jgi:maleamate amidohydrolase
MGESVAPRIWDAFLTPQDKAHLAVVGDPPRVGFGVKSAVLSVDNYRSAVGDRPEPLLEAVRSWRGSTGLAGWAALEQTELLLDSARKASIPVIHVTGLPEEDTGISAWGVDKGLGRTPVQPSGGAADRFARRFDIVEQASPLPGEVVLRKNAPSAFFGTTLMPHLVRSGIDTLIVCGESTSGCVRATVVDGCSYRLRMIVIEDCVYDRHEAAHAVNLFDMDQKYADVLSLEEVLAWMAQEGGTKQAPTRGT